MVRIVPSISHVGLQYSLLSVSVPSGDFLKSSAACGNRSATIAFTFNAESSVKPASFVAKARTFSMLYVRDTSGPVKAGVCKYLDANPAIAGGVADIQVLTSSGCWSERALVNPQAASSSVNPATVALCQRPRC